MHGAAHNGSSNVASGQGAAAAQGLKHQVGNQSPICSEQLGPVPALNHSPPCSNTAPCSEVTTLAAP